jgi:hypothetical protein
VLGYARGELRGATDLVIGGTDAGVEDELLHGLEGDDLGTGMTRLPWARARRTSGVSAGRATTSMIVSAASTTSGATGRSAAAGPPDIPTGSR